MDEKLFKRLHSLGVRRATARDVSEALHSGDKRASKTASSAVSDLTSAVAEIQDRISKGPEKRRKAAKQAIKKKKARKS